jgi:dienelactone hydrolase
MKITLTLLTVLLGIQTGIAQQLRSVAYKDGNQKLNGLVTSNAGKKLPGVLILPAWKGIDNEAKNAAIELEKQGYIAFVADIYGEGNIPADNAAAAKSQDNTSRITKLISKGFLLLWKN